MALLRPRALDRGRRPQPKRQADRSASARWRYPAITIARLIFEVALALAFLIGLFFGEAAVVSVAYVLFLAFSFHGPDRWGGNMMEYGFTDHFVFVAGLLFAAVRGLGDALVLRTGLGPRRK